MQDTEDEEAGTSDASEDASDDEARNGVDSAGAGPGSTGPSRKGARTAPRPAASGRGSSRGRGREAARGRGDGAKRGRRTAQQQEEADGGDGAPGAAGSPDKSSDVELIESDNDGAKGRCVIASSMRTKALWRLPQPCSMHRSRQFMLGQYIPYSTYGIQQHTVKAYALTRLLGGVACHLQ